MLPDQTRILITGANGHLGRRLIDALSATHPVTAVVRSGAARRVVEAGTDAARVKCVELDYRDADALANAARGCTTAVHLVGILKETAANRYVDAHERSTQALVTAARAQGIRRIVHVSILGADPASDNPALASRGRTERILLDCGITPLVLRVPMVLGEGDYAARSLRLRARSHGRREKTHGSEQAHVWLEPRLKLERTRLAKTLFFCPSKYRRSFAIAFCLFH